MSYIVATLILIAILVIESIVEHFRLGKIAKERPDDSICTFVRSFDYRSTDTKVIRAVYENVQAWLPSFDRGFPVRTTDTLEKDYKIDPMDVDDLLIDAAEQSGRDLSHTSCNPFYDRVKTVSDIVFFLCCQPILKPNAELDIPDQPLTH